MPRKARGYLEGARKPLKQTTNPCNCKIISKHALEKEANALVTRGAMFVVWKTKDPKISPIIWFVAKKT